MINRKDLLVGLWFPCAYGLLVLLLINLSLIRTQKIAAKKSLETTPIAMNVYKKLNVASSTGTAQVLGARIDAGDARALVLENFMRDTYHGEKGEESPLLPFADVIVQKADEHQIDYRLLPAIATCESNLGKRMPLRSCHNAWGIAVYTGTQEGACFSDWPKAIDWVSKYIKDKYFAPGITDLKSIGAIWAPPSVETGHSWSTCVQTFLDALE